MSKGEAPVDAGSASTGSVPSTERATQPLWPRIKDGDVVWIQMPKKIAHGEEFNDGTRARHPWLVVSNAAVLKRTAWLLHAVPLVTTTKDPKDAALDSTFFNEHIDLIPSDFDLEGDADFDARNRTALCEHARSLDARRVRGIPGRISKVGRKKLSDIRLTITWIFGC